MNSAGRPALLSKEENIALRKHLFQCARKEHQWTEICCRVFSLARNPPGAGAPKRRFQGTYAHFCFWAENSDFGGFCFGGQVLCCFWHLFGAYLGQLGMLGCATPTGAPQILPSAGEKVDKFFGGRSQARVWEDLCRTLPWSDTARRRRYVDFFGALDWELPSNAFSPNWLTLYLPFGKRNITIQRRIKRNPVAKEYTEGDRRIFFETLVVHFGN